MSEEAKKFSVPVLILIIILGDVFFGFILFFLSGWNFLWWEAWILLILLTFLMGFMLFWLNKHNPQVLRSRASMKGMLKKDIIPMILLVALFFAFIIVVSLDGGHYHWSTVPLWGKIIGYIGFVIGFIITVLVMKENAFASKVVRIDKEAGIKSLQLDLTQLYAIPCILAFYYGFFRCQ